MEFNIPLGKVIRVFTSTNLCVTGDFSGTSNGFLLMKDCVVKTSKEKYNAISGSIKIKDIEKLKVLTFVNDKFTFTELEV